MTGTPCLKRALSCFIICLGLLTSVLYAHAILKSAMPSAQQAVQGPELPIELKFNSKIDAKHSRLMLVSPDGVVSPLTIIEQSSPDTLTARATGLKSGAYVIRWQVLANDGHISRGEIPFRVQ